MTQSAISFFDPCGPFRVSVSMVPRNAANFSVSLKQVIEIVPPGKTSQIFLKGFDCHGVVLHTDPYRGILLNCHWNTVFTSMDLTNEVMWLVDWPVKMERYNFWMEKETEYFLTCHQREKYIYHCRQRTNKNKHDCHKILSCEIWPELLLHTIYENCNFRNIAFILWEKLQWTERFPPSRQTRWSEYTMDLKKKMATFTAFKEGKCPVKRIILAK